MQAGKSGDGGGDENNHVRATTIVSKGKGYDRITLGLQSDHASHPARLPRPPGSVSHFPC